ncbi:LysE family transporter [Desulfosporosinus sp. OT]|uniref:LysE family translocator n=1 Tax=Desulfosporosinus sp. OT TaxID=913865 RepID=UPI000223AEF9|nr:LysE family transporter [Desulfosporosinus sp. OT]EGW39619.1 lysE type translocator family protein [Desulfosporosinus sp. OT]
MNFTAFFAYCIIVTFTPGPTNIVILSTVHNYGMKKALEFTAGATLAFGILLALSATFNSVLFNLMPDIKRVMGIVGALYMLYLAQKLYKMDASADVAEQSGTFITGFLMQFVNPKVVLFVLTVISNFVIPNYSSFTYLALYVAIITAIGMAAFMTWVILGTVLKRFLSEYQSFVNTVMALSLIYCALMVSGWRELFMR